MSDMVHQRYKIGGPAVKADGFVDEVNYQSFV